MTEEKIVKEFNLRGFAQSLSEYFELCKEQFTFSVTIPNAAGLKHGRAHAPLKTCENFLRTKAPKALFPEEKFIDKKILAVGGTPGELFNENTTVDYTFSRPQTFLIYDKQSPDTKEYNQETNPNGFKWVKKSITIQIEGTKRVYTNTAPVITFGGKEYVWYNKKACEKNKSKVMKLIMHECYEKSSSFDASNGSNDFGEAKYFIEQNERLVTENCSKEELERIVPVKISSIDGYQTATPMYTPKQLAIIESQAKEANNSDREIDRK